jgi:threonine dehydrogenase-like Zn-dependent dehydrogenase
MTGSGNHPTSARVARLLGPGRLVWEEEALPGSLPAGSVLCRTVASAISPGTELAAYLGAPPLRDVPAYPRVQGYCNVAEVLATGEGVRSVARGDRVLTFSSHRSHFVLDESEVLLCLPDGCPADVASVTYLFHLGYNAILRSRVLAGSRVVVLGLGALGLATVAVARIAGARVLAVSEHERARQLAADFGAEAAEGRQAAGSRTDWADVVVATTNSWSDWHLALRVAARMGTVAVLGFPGRESPPGDFNPLDSRFFYAKQLRIEAVGLSPERPDSRGFLRFNERDNLQFLLDRIRDGGLPAGRMISGRFPPDRLEEAYRSLVERRDSPVTYVLEWA